MVRVNKAKLSNKQQTALFNQMNHVLSKLNEKQTGLFLSELLGEEERIILAKRLAVIILLLEGRSLYNISALLKISPTTADNINQKLKAGTYDQLINLLGQNKTDYFSILEAIDTILHLGGILPHYNGPVLYRKKPSI